MSYLDDIKKVVENYKNIHDFNDGYIAQDKDCIELEYDEKDIRKKIAGLLVEWETKHNVLSCVPENEYLIKESAHYSFLYALEVLHGRFLLGEPAIARSASYSCDYAEQVLQGRFVLGEPVIAKSCYFSYCYARNTIKGRFLEGESSIIRCANTSYLYAYHVIGGRFLEGEDEIGKSKEASYLYARDVLRTYYFPTFSVASF